MFLIKLVSDGCSANYPLSKQAVPQTLTLPCGTQWEHCIETNGVITGMMLSPDHQYLYVNCRPWKEALDMNKVGTSFQYSPPDISEEMTLTCYSLATYEKINVHVGHQAFTASEKYFFLFLSVADKLVAR